MSIDRNALEDAMIVAYTTASNCGQIIKRESFDMLSGTNAMDAMVDAVLAEVAKHETPSYKTSERTPTEADADYEGYVLAWVTQKGFEHHRKWFFVDYRSVTTASPYAFWMPVPPSPEKDSDQVFESMYASRPDSKEAKDVLKFIWDMALKYREEHPLK